MRKKTSSNAAKALKNFLNFLDSCDWFGRLPSAKSINLFERRQAYWLIHFKQAKKGKSTCKWDDDLQNAAKTFGLPDLFDVDTRTLRVFDLRGEKIAGFKVLRKSDIVSDFDQVMWICSNPDQELVELTSYELRRMKDDPHYLRSLRRSRNLVGKEIGCLKLLGVYDTRENGRETVWFVSRNDGKVNVLKKVTLPSFRVLRSYFTVLENQGNEALPEGVGIFDLTSQRFGRWTVIGYSNKASNNECVWNCVCDCGEISKVAGGKLRAGATLSCGCLRADVMSRIAKEKMESSVVS